VNDVFFKMCLYLEFHNVESILPWSPILLLEMAVIQKSVLVLLQQKLTFLPIETSSRYININLKNL
jgi:hypothetical protein